MRKPDYVWATNAAYSVLLSFPFCVRTDVVGVTDALEACRLMTYAQAAAVYGFDADVLRKASEHGFAAKNRGGKRLILIDEQAPLGVIRFTLAHEIGHIVLGHTAEDAVAEKEANCFARNLLCPAPVAYHLGLCRPEHYADVFQVTKKAAGVACERFQADRRNITTENWEMMLLMLIQYMEAA